MYKYFCDFRLSFSRTASVTLPPSPWRHTRPVYQPAHLAVPGSHAAQSAPENRPVVNYAIMLGSKYPKQPRGGGRHHKSFGDESSRRDKLLIDSGVGGPMLPLRARSMRSSRQMFCWLVISCPVVLVSVLRRRSDGKRRDFTHLFGKPRPPIKRASFYRVAQKVLN